MPNLREQLTGSWALQSYVLEPIDGTESREPMGPEPQGLLLYTNDGYMSAQLMRPGRPSFASSNFNSGRPEEVKSAATGYLAYSGPFRTDDTAGIVIHAVAASLFPNWIGVDQLRKVHLSGDTLVLSTVEPRNFGGKEYVARLTWKRAT